jgi:diguanylate cyclase (GGDEF)-like protein
MIFDIDHFKSINDRFGHPAGDEMLKLFSTVVVTNLRISDLSGRIGGEEFAALLPCSLEEGVLVAERVREAFELSGVVVDEAPVDTTVSIGVAGGPAGTELEVLLASADTALYQASAAAVTVSRRPRSCRCRWRTGGGRARRGSVHRGHSRRRRR